MIRIDKPVKIDMNEKVKDKVVSLQVTAFRDDKDDFAFYLMPNTPSFRFDGGKPIFQYLKYRDDGNRPAGKENLGGMAIFDVEFALNTDQMEMAKKHLQEKVVDVEFKNKGLTPPKVVINQLSFNKGAASINLSEGNLVTRVKNPGSPSLFGNFITPFTIEFDKYGASLFEAAMSGKGGTVQVSYDVFTWARLPPVKATGVWHAGKSKEYYQKILKEDKGTWNAGVYEETKKELFENNEFREINIDYGGMTDPMLKQALNDEINKYFNEAIARQLIKDSTGTPPEAPNVRDVTIEMVQNATSDVKLSINQEQAIEWNPAPRGTLKNIVEYTDSSGKPIKWSDYYQEISLDDPFFDQLMVNIRTNVDFGSYPIDSIQVHLEYDGKDHKGNPIHKVNESLLTKDIPIAKFSAYTDKSSKKYKYWIKVNYTDGKTPPYKSALSETDEQNLIIGMDQLGIFSVTAMAGLMDFDRIAQARVEFKGEADGQEIPPDTFTIDKNHREYRVLKILPKPISSIEYSYRITYLTTDNKQMVVDWVSDTDNELFVNGPYKGYKSITFKCLGDMQGDIDFVDLSLTYEDAKNSYRISESITLDAANRSKIWSIPLLSETGGKATYSGNIVHKNGTADAIPVTEPTSDTVSIGAAADILEVSVDPVLLDLESLNAAVVHLRYSDTTNKIDIKKDITFKPGTAANAILWAVKIKDKSQDKYSWSADFFPKDPAKPSKISTRSQETSDRTLMVEMPS